MHSEGNEPGQQNQTVNQRQKGPNHVSVSRISLTVSPGHPYSLTAIITGAFPTSYAHSCVGDDSYLMAEELGQKGHFQIPFSAQGVRSHSAIPGLTTTHGNWVLQMPLLGIFSISSKGPNPNMI